MNSIVRTHACEWCGVPGTLMIQVAQEGELAHYHRLCAREAKAAMLEMVNICAGPGPQLESRTETPEKITEDHGYELIFDRSTWTLRMEPVRAQAAFQHNELNLLFKK